jgi:hypothetical protein
MSDNLRTSAPYVVVMTDSGRAQSFVTLADAIGCAMREHGRILKYIANGAATVVVGDFTEGRKGR